MYGKDMGNEWELWCWEGGRDKGPWWNRMALPSLEFHKGFSASQSVSHKSPGLYLVWCVGASLQAP